MKLWHDVRLLHWLANALIALSLLSMIGAGGWWMVQRPGHALRSVSIDPMAGTELRHVSSLLLGQAVQRPIKGNFFTVDLEAVRVRFEQVPWVRRATVRRIWPNRLEVAIEEHRPLARWGDGRLLNTFGELYTANLDEAEADGPLPYFAGPQGSETRVLTRYEELRRWIAPVGRAPQTLVLSARHAWAARLDDGTQLMLGRDQGLPIEERVQRWVEAYPRVKARLPTQALVIDLRYPNGFAVRPAGGAALLGSAPDANGTAGASEAALLAAVSE